MNTPKQQQEMKESICKDQAKQIKRLEELECENKLNDS
jgi:hypothetical protein